MRSVSDEERRARLVARHHLAGDAADARAVVAALVAVHATDPASLHLAVLARSRRTTLRDLAAAMYDDRVLVRWTAMRRTLFLVDRDDVPMVQAAVSGPLAATLRRALVRRLDRAEPSVGDDPDGWLARCEERVERALERRGSATGTDLRHDVPELATRLPPPSPQSLTSPLLTVMGTAGRLVRGAPIGAWTTRNHRWEPVRAWWPDGVPVLDEAEAQAALARRWLERYGPATVEDLEWWTGWTKATTRRALAALDVEEVDLRGRPGIDLVDAAPAAPVAPTARLLPALDPTPMGWRHREWFTAADPAPLYDAAGNIGPTAWWDGELVGGWASTPGGVRVRLLVDRGREAAEAVSAAAAELERRLDGVVVTPAARTPLERELSQPGIVPASV